MSSLAQKVISNRMSGMSNETADFAMNEVCFPLETERTIDQETLSLYNKTGMAHFSIIWQGGPYIAHSQFKGTTSNSNQSVEDDRSTSPRDSNWNGPFQYMAG